MSQARAQDLPTCPVCSEVFNNTDRVPHAFPCMHNSCSCCLLRWKRKTEIMKCPICKTPAHDKYPPVNSGLLAALTALVNERKKRPAASLDADDADRPASRQRSDAEDKKIAAAPTMTRKQMLKKLQKLKPQRVDCLARPAGEEADEELQDVRACFAWGVAIDKDGLIYVSSQSRHSICVFHSDGTFVREWGSYGSRGFKFPYGVAITDDGLVYVVDQDNHRICVFQSDGTRLAKWGKAELQNPIDLAISKEGLVYVSDIRSIRIFQSDGTFVGHLGSDHLRNPEGVALSNNGLLYVADHEESSNRESRICVFRPDGTLVKEWGSKQKLNEPVGVAVCSCSDGDLVYVVDRGNRRVCVFLEDGTLVHEWKLNATLASIVLSGSGDMVCVADRGSVGGVHILK